MPLSKVERQVLGLIASEHRQTRRGARTSIVHIGMNAVNSQQKARVIDVLTALKKRGLLVFGSNEAWMLTAQGVGALHEAPPPQETVPALIDVDDTNVVDMTPEAEAPITVQSSGHPAPSPLPVDAAHLLTSERAPTDLLNRCAAMNATLLAQAQQAYEAGEPDAWRDLHWLMETAQQLVALGGES